MQKEILVTKILSWTQDGKKYKVYNIPVNKREEYETVGAETAVKLEMLKHLMENNEIEQIIDYSEVAELEIF